MTPANDGVLHGGSMAGDGQRLSIMVYGPPLNETMAREARGDDGELIQIP